MALSILVLDLFNSQFCFWILATLPKKDLRSGTCSKWEPPRNNSERGAAIRMPPLSKAAGKRARPRTEQQQRLRNEDNARKRERTAAAKAKMYTGVALTIGATDALALLDKQVGSEIQVLQDARDELLLQIQAHNDYFAAQLLVTTTELCKWRNMSSAAKNSAMREQDVAPHPAPLPPVEAVLHIQSTRHASEDEVSSTLRHHEHLPHT